MKINLYDQILATISDDKAKKEREPYLSKVNINYVVQEFRENNISVARPARACLRAVIFGSFSTMGIPVHTGSLGLDLRYAKYVVYRMDAQYYSFMSGAPYVEVSTLSNSSVFGQIYSSASYVLFLRISNVSQVLPPTG